MRCKGVEQVVNDDDTHASDSKVEDNALPASPITDDEFDVEAFEPSFCESSPHVPAMPRTIRPPQTHREHIPTLQAPFNVAVARSVNKQEMYSNHKARAAVRQEWDRRSAKRCWAEAVSDTHQTLPTTLRVSIAVHG